jgi:hypothetical protein
MSVSDQLLTAFVAGALTSFAVWVDTLIYSQRLNEIGRGVELRFDEVNRRIDHSREILPIDLHRMEQVLDIRLKHLEEHLR